MIKFIILLTFASVALCNINEECSCGTGFYINIETNQCQSNPSSEETGYVENCLRYIKKDNASSPGTYFFYCDQCVETHYQKLISSNNYECKPHGKENCIKSKKQSYFSTIRQCTECAENNYLYQWSCYQYPDSSQTDAFIQGCSKYQYTSELICLECSIDGYYGDISNSSDRKCVDAGNSIDGCLKYLSSTECKVCQTGKILQTSSYTAGVGSACVDPPSDMPGCIEFDTLDGVAFRCLKCSGLLFLKGDYSGCDSSGSISIDNCDEYGGVGICGKCDLQYYKNGDFSECLQCPSYNCQSNDSREVCKAVFSSDCASAGVDSTLFTDFQGPSCIKNQCLESASAVKNKFTIAPPNFTTLNLIEYMGYNSLCFQTKIVIKASSDIVSYDQIVNTDLTQCSSPCEIEIIYQFRNVDYDISKQSGSFTYTGSAEISGLSSLNDEVSNIYPSGPLGSNPELATQEIFQISRRKQSDFSTDASAGDIALGTEVYYKVTSFQAGIDTSRLKVYLIPSGALSENNKILLPSTAYSLVPDTGNEYYKLTITKIFIGEFNISVVYE